MTHAANPAITGCLLAGGEGRRMLGQDKGWVSYKGRPLGEWVLQSLSAQTSTLMISANRNLPAYEALLASYRPDGPIGRAQAVLPDDPDLPPASGPLAGILTALRHCETDWLLVVPCDVPHLPPNLAERLLAEALRTDADIVVPATHPVGEEVHMHWVCALIHKRVCPQTEALFVTGERKIGNWVRAFPWSSVFFPDDAAFTNMNTPETLHGRA